MSLYIVTFYTHYAALSFFKILKDKNIKGRLMPTPREVSSSCGTCVEFSSDSIMEFREDDLDSVYVLKDKKYVLVKKY